jgi:hypothetical protein
MPRTSHANPTRIREAARVAYQRRGRVAGAQVALQAGSEIDRQKP